METYFSHNSCSTIKLTPSEHQIFWVFSWSLWYFSQYNTWISYIKFEGDQRHFEWATAVWVLWNGSKYKHTCAANCKYLWEPIWCLKIHRITQHSYVILKEFWVWITPKKPTVWLHSLKTIVLLLSVVSTLCYRLLGDSGLEGFRHWLQLVHCTYLLLRSKHFVWGQESKSEVWVSFQYDGVWCLELSLRFEEPKGDEHRVKCKARVWRLELRTRVTSDWYIK